MCFYSHQTKTAQELKNRFNAKIKDETLAQPAFYNAFEHPKTPIISNKEPDLIQFFNWGLLPNWAKDFKIQKSTLNARLETIHEKVAFKSVVHQRCLIISDGFWEWQWLDPKGKQKQKFEIGFPDEQLFAFAGLWSEWKHPTTQEISSTYTILTTEANELMSTIHNTKKRMPIIVSEQYEKAWLNGENYKMANDNLIAKAII